MIPITKQMRRATTGPYGATASLFIDGAHINALNGERKGQYRGYVGDWDERMALLSATTRRWSATQDSRAVRLLPIVALIIDVAIMVVVGWMAIIGRRELTVFQSSVDIENSVTIAGPLIIVGWLAMIALRGGYKTDVFGAGSDEFRRVLNASLVAAGLAGVGCYLAKFQLSRGFFLLAFFLGIPALLLGRLMLRTALRRARHRGAFCQRVLIAGSRSHVDEIAAVLRRESWLGYRVIGALTPEYDLSEETSSGVPVLGNVNDVSSMVAATGAEVIFFAGGSVGASSQLRASIWDLERHSVQVVVAPSVTDISSERIKIRPTGGLPLIHVDPPTWTDASRWGKRTFDVVGAGVLLVLFAPLFLFSAAQIKLHDRGPVLFAHSRAGRNGHSFRCLKFRTMVVDAESLAGDLQQKTGQSALLFKVKDDPRITKPGVWLRRFSIDELPQLINVLKGDMSLVGPRPQVAAEVALYDDSMSRRLHVRPGMTGLWQVSGRNDLSAAEAIRLDLYYVDNWSMMQDLAILSRTVGAVVSSRGAY